MRTTGTWPGTTSSTKGGAGRSQTLLRSHNRAQLQPKAAFWRRSDWEILLNPITLAPEHFHSEGDALLSPMTDPNREIQLLESPDVEHCSAEQIESVMVDSWYQGGERYWRIAQQPSTDSWVGTRHYDD